MAITFRAAGTTSTGNGVATLTINAPAGVVATDVLIAVLLFNGGSNIAITPPTGWSGPLRQNDGTAAGLAAYYALGSVASYQFSFTPNAEVLAFALAYIGVDTVTPLDIGGGSSQLNGSSTTFTAPTVTTVTDGALVICAFGAENSVESHTFSEAGSLVHRVDDDFVPTGNNKALDIADVIKSPAGVTGAQTTTVTFATTSIGMTFPLRPFIPALPFVTVQFRSAV